MKTVEFQDGYGQNVRVQLSSSGEARIYIKGQAMVGAGQDAPEVEVGLLLPPDETRIMIAALNSMLRCLEE